MSDIESSEEAQDVNDETQEVVEETSESEETTEEETAEETEEEVSKSVPYDRFKEKADEAAVLRRALELVQRPQQQQVSDEPLPEIDADVAKVIQSVINKTTRNVQQIIGNVLEQLDEVKATQVIPNYREYSSQIQTLREEKANQGVYMTREDAFSFLVGKGKIVNKEKSQPKTKKVVKVTSETKGAIKKETTKGSGPAKDGSSQPNKDSLEALEARLAGKKF